MGAGMGATFEVRGSTGKIPLVISDNVGTQKLKRLNLDKIDFYHVWCIRRVDQYELETRQ